jgi:hypothetical protein
MSNKVEPPKHAAQIILSNKGIKHAIPPLKTLLMIVYAGKGEGIIFNSPP